MRGAPLAIVVAIAGGFGAIGRYVGDFAVQRRLRILAPVGTIVVNVLGSFILGLITGVVVHHHVPSDVRLIVGVGFCGGLTTFSTATSETVRLAREGEIGLALGVALGGTLLSALAGALGLGIALL